LYYIVYLSNLFIENELIESMLKNLSETEIIKEVNLYLDNVEIENRPKYLSEAERLEFIQFLEQNKMTRIKFLMHKLLVGKVSVSKNIARCKRKPRKVKTPRLWYEHLQLYVENLELKAKINKLSRLFNE